jgi:hypothetical protein
MQAWGAEGLGLGVGISDFGFRVESNLADVGHGEVRLLFSDLVALRLTEEQVALGFNAKM